jgi:proline iminopeptidase
MPEQASSIYLDTGQGHRLHVQQFGPKDGIPLLFLHGGPGSGFDVKYYDNFYKDLPVRFISFDQRGCGKSQLFGNLESNTTQHLLADIENIRTHFGIEKWIVAGHSWGSTLALLYAQSCLERCNQLLLSSIFLGRRKDQEWTMKGSQVFFPDAYGEMIEGLSSDPDADIQPILYKMLTEGTGEQQKEAAFRFMRFGANLVRLNPQIVTMSEIDDRAVNMAKILLHYALNDFFIEDNQILENMSKLDGIPVSILHGRLDMDCRVEQAFELKAAIPHAQLYLVDGSHSLSEEPMRSAYSNMISKALE